MVFVLRICFLVTLCVPVWAQDDPIDRIPRGIPKWKLDPAEQLMFVSRVTGSCVSKERPHRRIQFRLGKGKNGELVYVRMVTFRRDPTKGDMTPLENSKLVVEEKNRTHIQDFNRVFPFSRLDRARLEHKHILTDVDEEDDFLEDDSDLTDEENRLRKRLRAAIKPWEKGLLVAAKDDDYQIIKMFVDKDFTPEDGGVVLIRYMYDGGALSASDFRWLKIRLLREKNKKWTLLTQKKQGKKTIWVPFNLMSLENHRCYYFPLGDYDIGIKAIHLAQVKEAELAN